MVGRSRLSEKVILLTVLFVLIAEMVIFIPSVAAFRQEWLADRAAQAGLLAQAIEGVPDYEGSEALSSTFMKQTGVEMVAAETGGTSQLILGMSPDAPVLETVDLREGAAFSGVGATLLTLARARDGVIRVVSNSPVQTQSTVEYLVPQTVLREAMWEYFRNIAGLSLIIALITGTLIYLALNGLIVRPVRRLAAQLARFREAPLRQRNFGPPSRRADEIGDLEREFRTMKRDVRAAFRQRDRLATLGLAVAKIQHDLRNVLTTAQLVSDRIATDPDARVAKMGRKLERVIDRGIRIATETLDYSKQAAGDVEPADVRIAAFLGEVAADVLTGFESLQVINAVPPELGVRVDEDHTYRLFHNLFRNAGQAMDGMEPERERRLDLSARVDAERVFIHVRDTGPGLPARTRETLFTPFAGASGAGSTGLGLSISKELAEAQGGSLELVDSDAGGTEFRVGLPGAG